MVFFPYFKVTQDHDESPTTSHAIAMSADRSALLHAGPVSDLWCFDVSVREHRNIVAGIAELLFMQQDPSQNAFHVCGLWLILKQLDIGVGPAHTSPGIACAAVRLGPASYDPKVYHENNGWHAEMTHSWPYPTRAYPILEIKLFAPAKVRFSLLRYYQ